MSDLLRSIQKLFEYEEFGFDIFAIYSTWKSKTKKIPICKRSILLAK
jgi:hypothetical protein